LAVPIIVLYEVGLFLSWLAWPEQGDYMFVKKIRAGLGWVLRKIRWLSRKVKNVVLYPVRKTRWAYRKIRKR
jgi:hypothetical protein